MNIGQTVGSPLVKVTPSTSLYEVARLMSTRHVGAVVVTDGLGEGAPLIGIVTDRDIVNAQLQYAKDLSSLNVGAAMSRNVLTLLPDESVDGAIAHLRARGVRRAPVVSAEGTPLALVSTDDLISQVSFELLSIAGIIAQQAQGEHVITRKAG